MLAKRIRLGTLATSSFILFSLPAAYSLLPLWQEQQRANLLEPASRFQISGFARSARTRPSQTRAMASTTTSSPPPELKSSDAMFGRFRIPSETIFYRSAFCMAFVNLRPIVPGHCLISPVRCVRYLKDLTEDEYTDLWLTARRVQAMLETHRSDSNVAFNVAVQDGKAAGQSVPHVHIHVLPRVKGDFERNDDVYEELQEWAPRSTAPSSQPDNEPLVVPDDCDRKDRTQEEMFAEAEEYRRVVESMAKL